MKVVVSFGTFFLVTGSLFVASDPFSSSVQISPDLLGRLKDGERVNIFIKLAEGSSNVIQQVTQARFFSREMRLNTLHHLLVHHAETSQKDILDFFSSRFNLLSNPPKKIKSFWITNQIYVEGADDAIVSNLRSTFSSKIESIYENTIVAQIVAPVEMRNVTKKNDEEVLWGLKRIQVPEAQKELTKAIEGVEIRVGTIDTGVRGTHEALRDNFVGEGGWLDALDGTTEPWDKMGHGTHTTATIVGSQGVGVAPWAKWMHCRACPTLGCSLEALITCGEFMTCPGGSNKNADCSLAPHIMSNSWSGGQGATWYNDVIEAWRAAGIIPVYSIGNFGNAFCGTANYPGDLESVIAVGSTTDTEDLSWFSSIGPTKIGGSLIKPDVTAPGSDIISAYHTSDDAYESMSGTSMACPMTSGIVVMLLTRNPEMTFEQVKHVILSSTEHGLKTRRLVCQGIPDTEYPNHVYGYGRVNALRSIKAAASENVI